MNDSALTPRSRPTLLIAVAAAAALLGLTGCTMDFQPQKEQQKQQDPPPSTTDAEDSAPSQDAPVSAGGSREEYADAVDRTISCPGGALDIADISSVIALDSDCTTISVSGAGTVLLAKNIETLEVIGTDNVVFVDQLSTLDVSGQGNVVTWETGSPTVSNAGVNNQLNPAP